MRARGILADRPDAPAHVHPPPGTRNGRPLAVRPEDVPARDDPSGAAGTASSGPALHAGQLTRALRRRENWIQLLEFGVVGASGYIVNLAVYALLLKGAGLHYLAAATGSFLVAASWNYWWNRSWTFRAQRGHFGIQGMRFLIVSATVYCAKHRDARSARLGRPREDPRASDRDHPRHPAQLPRQQTLVVPALTVRPVGFQEHWVVTVIQVSSAGGVTVSQLTKGKAQRFWSFTRAAATRHRGPPSRSCSRKSFASCASSGGSTPPTRRSPCRTRWR